MLHSDCFPLKIFVLCFYCINASSVKHLVCQTQGLKLIIDKLALSHVIPRILKGHFFLEVRYFFLFIWYVMLVGVKNVCLN